VFPLDPLPRPPFNPAPLRHVTSHPHEATGALPFAVNHQPIRCAARALIVLDGRLLTVVLRGKDGDLHVLPGGGQLHGETLADTVRRECREELGVDIVVQDLAYVREYIGANHTYASKHRDFHQVEAVFHATIADVSRLGAGVGQDHKQVGLAWIPLVELHRFRFSPSILKSFVKDGALSLSRAYLGDDH
jgi:8-oxo-dGTP pyrophosphatase MutT (NUDIX family)